MSQTPWQRSEETLDTTDSETESAEAPIIDLTGMRPDQRISPEDDEEPRNDASDQGAPTSNAPSQPSEDTLPSIDDLEGAWVTVAKAAQLLEVSETTVRRRLGAGTLRGQLVHDPAIGSKRWMVDEAELPSQRSEPTGALVPIEAIDRLEAAWEALREATARAERAERVAEFEKERRIEAERDRKRLREIQAAETELTQRVVRLEKEKRAQIEKERDRLRAMLEAEEPKRKSRWKTFTDGLFGS